MRYVIKIFLWGWLVFFGFIGSAILFNTPRQMKQDQEFVKWGVEQPVRSIKEYLHKHDTLPPQSNYDAVIITDTKHIPKELLGKIDSIPKDGWILEVWREEWAEYYISWKDEYIGSRWSWGDGITQLFGSLVIGIFPVGTYTLVKKIRVHFAARRLTRQTTTLQKS